MVLLSEGSSCSLIADLKPRIPSPIPLPNSGSLLGPNTSKAIPKITNRCVGCNSPSNMNPPFNWKLQNIAVREFVGAASVLGKQRPPIAGVISDELSRQDLQFFRRNGLDRIPIKLQMRINHFWRKPPDPVIEREVHDFARLEHLQKHQVSIAGVLHIMTSIEWNEADIVGLEVHGTCRPNRHKHSHSSLPRHVELPLRGIGMPMEFAHTSGLDD